MRVCGNATIGSRAYSCFMYVPSRWMADLEKRGGYVPRREREQKAYNALRAGSVTGVAGVVTLVLSVITSLSFAIPVILLLLTAFFVYRFLKVTGQR